MSSLRKLTLQRPPQSPSVGNADTYNQLLSPASVMSEIWRLTNENISENNKALQNIKDILEERINVDKQYADNFQRLATKAVSLASNMKTVSIDDVCRQIFTKWFDKANAIRSDAERLRSNVVDDVLKNLIEQTNDLKKFLEFERRQYEVENQKAEKHVKEAEERYLYEAKALFAKNAEFKKVKTGVKAADDKRIQDMERSVIEKRDYVYRAHNEYVLSIREYNFTYERYICKIESLILYYEAAQFILNQQWQILLKGMSYYGNNNRHDSNGYVSIPKNFCATEIPKIDQELSKLRSNITSMAKSPIIFSEAPIQATGLSNLKSNEFIIDESTNYRLSHDGLKQKIQALTSSLQEDNNELEKATEDIAKQKNQQLSYNEYKIVFLKNQRAEHLRMKIAMEEILKNELQERFEEAGFKEDDETEAEIPAGLSDRLEDLPYFHGIIPRSQTVGFLLEKGDYLLRRNNDGKIVVSVLWTDPSKPGKLKDFHFCIVEKNNSYSFHEDSVSKPTVSKLISYYIHQKLTLHDDGVRLIRAVEKPNYVINNDEITIFQNDKLGQGNFGEVYRGEYRKQMYAIKVLRSTVASRNSKDRERFINEALVLKRYKHDRIVKFIGIAAYREPLMIVMELVKRGSLNHYLKANDLRVSQLTQLCIDIAKGMAYLESNHVIHRDLAARNCLVDKDGRAKVSDFGLSRCLYDDEEYFNQVKQFPVRWWAVEALLNEPYTSKSDVWSYGVTMWEVFSKAELPYKDIPLTHMVIDAVRRGKRLEKPDKCPVNLYEIMCKCWLKNPQDRHNFATLVELIKKENSILTRFSFFNGTK